MTGPGNDSILPEFIWASGEECSDPLVTKDGRPHRVDELESTGHLARVEQDLMDAASLGITHYRYGMSWRRTEVEPGRYDWSLWDRALGACYDAGLEPIVDLCHFGLPDRFAGFADPSWVGPFLDYVAAFLDRYPEPRLFTPINEPTVTAVQSCLLGAWNERKAEPDAFAAALGNIVLANLEAMRAIRENRDGWNLMAEGFAAPARGGWIPDSGPTAMQVVLPVLCWDLLLGHDPLPEASPIIERMNDRVLERISELQGKVNVVAGHDVYPIFVFDPSSTRPPSFSEVDLEERVILYGKAARAFHDRYGVDFWIAETSNLGLPPEQGPDWIRALAAEVGRLRDDGVPVRGICWYSRGDQHDWDTGLVNPTGRVTQVGLFDIARNPRPALAAFRELAMAGDPRSGTRSP